MTDVRAARLSQRVLVLVLPPAARLARITARALVAILPAGKVHVWTGTAFVDAQVKVWNGTAFVDATAVKVWNGTAFVDTGGTPAPVPVSLWDHTTPQGTADTSETGSGVTLATRIRPTAPCTAVAAWFQKGLAASGTYTANLWRQETTSADVTLLATKAETKSGTGWHRIAFDTPVALAVPNDINNWGYVIGVHYAASPFGYHATGAYFASPRSVPPLTAPAGNTSLNVSLNGRFNYSADPAGYPSQQFNSGGYFIDLEVTT